MPLEVGGQVALSIEDLTQEGQGVGKLEGFTIFCSQTIPGDRVLAQIEQIKSRYALARPLEFYQSSPQRTAAPCAFFAQCGGCRLQEMTYPAQLKFKKHLVQQTLKRIGKISCNPEIAASEPWHYRNKAIVRAFAEQGQIRLAYLQEKSHLSARNPEENFFCYILDRDLNELLQKTEQKLNQFHFPPELLESVLVRKAPAGGEILLLWQIKVEHWPRLAELAAELQKDLPQLVSVWKQTNDQPPILVAGKEEITDDLLGLKFRLSPFTFYQVNQPQAAHLYQIAAEFLDAPKGNLIIDAYCGIGTISLYLASLGWEILGIEDFKPSVLKARENACLNQLTKVKFQVGKTEIVLPALFKKGLKPKAVILDPPRAGCSSKVLMALAKAVVSRIVYISCNPAALARDLQILTQQGYHLQKVKLIDMFPQTAHVETICLLTRII